MQLQQDRYELQHMLGEGGMAQVHQALDIATGRKLALKRRRPQGGDLQRIAPVEYRTACALAYDICSALSVVHSRRMVFRDLSPNNVRRTADGLAKLTDFGALAPMGPSRDVVGTLPCVAPEALSFASLDARTDVFALGATLYFALTRRHAYPGRSVEELTALWKHPPVKPSDLIGGIPPALDQLVLESLQLDPERRPSSAGEVMERLSAIASLARHDELLVKQAYLATPTMVGREAAIETIRAHLLSAKEQRGGSLCLQGVAGIGRTRMLEASGLEAKRNGMLVLRADARDAQQGDYGVVRALARSMLTQAPTLARKLAEPHRDHLVRIIPELAASAEQTSDPSKPEEDLLHVWKRYATMGWTTTATIDLYFPEKVFEVDACSGEWRGAIVGAVTEHPGFLGGRLATGALASAAFTPTVGIPMSVLSSYGSAIQAAQAGAPIAGIIQSIFGPME